MAKIAKLSSRRRYRCAHVLGVVLNKIDPRHGDYYYNYYYYQYDDDGGSAHRRKRNRDRSSQRKGK